MARARKTTTTSATSDKIATLRIDLVDSRPRIWREIEVPVSLTLLNVHDVVQIAFGWGDYHMWQFEIAGALYGTPNEDNPKIRDAGMAQLGDLLDKGSATLTYVYDFGDYWEHRIKVSRVRDGDPELPYPRLVAGQMSEPPEDCGGLLGYYALLEARDDPDHPEHLMAAEILRGRDPKAMNDTLITVGLGRMARQFDAARARIKRKADGEGSA